MQVIEHHALVSLREFSSVQFSSVGRESRGNARWLRQVLTEM